jgi:hypothetical protein
MPAVKREAEENWGTLMSDDLGAPLSVLQNLAIVGDDPAITAAPRRRRPSTATA